MTYSQPINDLITAIENKTNHHIKVQVNAQSFPYIRNEQSNYYRAANGDDVIVINNQAASEYLLAHELLHLWMNVSAYSQLQFNLVTGLDAGSDRLLKNIATLLYENVTHVTIHQQQVAMGVWDDRCQQMYLAGFDKTIMQKENDNPQVLVFQILNILDALIILGENHPVFAKWQVSHPDAYRYAQTLLTILQSKDTATSFALRRMVVRIFAAFERILTDEIHLPNLAIREFATLTPVLSARQMRLQTAQVFKIVPSAFENMQTKKQAYVGLGASDQQNAFVLPINPQNIASINDYLDRLNQQPVMQMLTKYHFNFLQR